MHQEFILVEVEFIKPSIQIIFSKKAQQALEDQLETLVQSVI